MLVYSVLALALIATAAFGTAHLARNSNGVIATPTVTASATALPSASDKAFSLVVIGASDAFGIGTDQPETESWPAVLAHDISSKAHLLDLGIPSATVEMAARDEVPVAAAATPDEIAILLGINDIDDGVTLATFDQQLRALVSMLRNETTAAIYIANLPDLALLPYFAKDDPIGLSTEVTNWNADIAAICASDGATLVDLFSAWSELSQHPEYVSSDGLHPSAVGAQRIAEAFFTAIQGTAP